MCRDVRKHARYLAQEADWEGRCAALEARVKTLQAEVGRKQEMLQGLRQRMDGLVSAAEERGAVAEQGKAQVTLLRRERVAHASSRSSPRVSLLDL